MTEISVPHIIKASEWGPDDPEVERIWFILKDTAHLIDDEKMADEADFWADRIYEKLDQARNRYKAIHAEDFNHRPTSEQDSEYDGLYAALWSVYKDRLPKFASTINYEIGFMFAKTDQFDAQAAAFVRRYPEHEWLVDYTKNQRANWHDGLRDQRNAREHDGDLRDMPNATNINNLKYAKHLFIQVANAVEGISVSLISYRLSEQWRVVIVNDEADVFTRENRFQIRHALMGPVKGHSSRTF